MFPHLLVAIDRRASAHRAAALGVRTAACIGARVTVLFVVTLPDEAPPFPDGPGSQSAIDAGERLFRRMRRMANLAGVPCVCRYAFGRDARMIVREAATAHHCDLVLVNAPGAAVPAIGATAHG
ncbi:universal stress protein [Luteibacter yeojuensis]|uniref:Universal stress protein n=1 Tax=Luteibacter yeojuensis TaxID=345309 RepID=A0A7X5QSM6_9GAMM|nr:universal stress protein [Luteibacter yeojuensis]